MKKDTLSGLDIDLYSEKFSNGFEVYLVPLKNMKRYYNLCDKIWFFNY